MPTLIDRPPVEEVVLRGGHGNNRILLVSPERWYFNLPWFNMINLRFQTMGEDPLRYDVYDRTDEVDIKGRSIFRIRK